MLGFYRTLTPAEVRRFCGESYQCFFDYAVTMDREFAKWSKHYQDEFVNIKKYGLRTGKPKEVLKNSQENRHFILFAMLTTNELE